MPETSKYARLTSALKTEDIPSCILQIPVKRLTYPQRERMAEPREAKSTVKSRKYDKSTRSVKNRRTHYLSPCPSRRRGRVFSYCFLNVNRRVRFACSSRVGRIQSELRRQTYARGRARPVDRRAVSSR